MIKYLKAEKLTAAVKWLLYLTAFTPLIISGAFLFPYISARTVFFRLLIEAALLVLILLIWLYRLRLPEKGGGNYIFVVFIAFVATNIISSFFSFSPLIAWFSDIERMWGVFTLLHLFMFYWLLRTFFTGKEWKIFFSISLIVSLYVAFYGIIQHYPDVFGIKVYQAGIGRIISTLGNPAYVAIYLIFNAFFALFLWSRSHSRLMKWYYAAVMAVDLFAFNLAGIRGTTLAVLAAAVVAGLVYIILGHKKSYKISIAALLIIAPLIFTYAFLHPEGKLAQSNPVLQRIATISLSGDTTETRLIGWRASLKGFLEHPIFGVGMDNYYVVFNKYFNSNYYLYAASEPYFDRSHNAFLDVLVMNGAVGFIVFLGFPIGIGYYLLRGYREDKINLDELLIFLALTITYFVHLFFVFDDLNSYLFFIILLAFVEYRYQREPLVTFGEQRAPRSLVNLSGGAAAIIIIIIIYSLNIKVLQASNAVIDAFSYRDDIMATTATFQKAIDYHIIPSRNIVTSYVSYLTEVAGNLPKVASDAQKKAALTEGIKNIIIALDKEIKKDRFNALLYDRLSIINNIAYLLTNDRAYLQNSFDAVREAIALSPEHLHYYYTLVDTYIIAGRMAEAIQTAGDALKINSEYATGYFYLAKAYTAAGQFDQALIVVKQLKPRGYFATNNVLFSYLANKFEENKEELKAIEVMAEATKVNPNDAQSLARLIKLYLKTGQNDKAIATAQKLPAANASFAKDADYIIGKIQAGQAQELLQEIASRENK